MLSFSCYQTQWSMLSLKTINLNIINQYEASFTVNQLSFNHQFKHHSSIHHQLNHPFKQRITIEAFLASAHQPSHPDLHGARHGIRMLRLQAVRLRQVEHLLVITGVRRLSRMVHINHYNDG